MPKYTNVVQDCIKSVHIKNPNAITPHKFAHVGIEHRTVRSVLAFIAHLGGLPGSLNSLCVGSCVGMDEVDRMIDRMMSIAWKCTDSIVGTPLIGNNCCTGADVSCTYRHECRS